MRRSVLLVGVLGLISACGGSPTSSTPPVPNVAGNYSGSTLFTEANGSFSFSCPTTMTVTQSGANVNLTSLTLNGDCGGESFPVGQATIDSSGSLGSETGSSSDADCGAYHYTGTGGFSGNQFHLSLSVSYNTPSPGCQNFNMTVTLNRV